MTHPVVVVAMRTPPFAWKILIVAAAIQVASRMESGRTHEGELGNDKHGKWGNDLFVICMCGDWLRDEIIGRKKKIGEK